MNLLITPLVCLLTDHESHNELCLRYWAVDPTGRWTESFDALLTASGLRQPAMLKMVEKSCRAYLRHIRCKVCNRAAEMKFRSDYIPLTGALAPKLGHARDLCYSCRTTIAAAQQEAAVAAAQQHSERVYSAVGRTAEQMAPIDYSALSYSQVFILYSILVAANLGWEDEKICALNSQPGGLAPDPDLAERLYERLHRERIISPSPLSNPAAFLDDECERLVFHTRAVEWILAKDKHGRPIREIVPLLAERLGQPDRESAEELWYLVAEAECKRYFLEQCQRYRFVKESIFSDKVADAFRYCLRELSIGQVWHVIYYVMRNLAALSQDKTYARQHVYNMIPGSIRRFADNKISNKKEVRPWSRPNLHSEAWITSILFDKVFQDGNMLFETLSGNAVGEYVSSRNDAVGGPQNSETLRCVTNIN